MQIEKTYKCGTQERQEDMEKKLMKNGCRKDIKKKSFPQRNLDTWNVLDKEVVKAKLISEFKAKLDKDKFGGETVQA